MEDDGSTVAGGGGGRSEARDWSNLTEVCLINVFLKLSVEDRWKGPMLVCRSWLLASRDPSLFSSFDLEPSFSGSGGGPDVAAWWTPAFERRVDSMLSSAAENAAGSIREIRVRHCTDRSLFLVAERSPKLEVLSIRSSQNVTDASLFRIASCCHVLRELDISNCYEVSYKSIEVIGQSCPNLEVLKRNLLNNWFDPSQHAGIVPDEYLRACPQDGDIEAAAIAKFMPKLKRLELRFSKLTITGLIPISEGCGDLETLDLFGCANLTDRAIEQALRNLRNLKSLVRPYFYNPRSIYHTERYGHWNLYDERFQTNAFQI